MSLSPALHKCLLAGTSRAPLAADSATPPLQPLLAGVTEPMRLWHTVAATDLWQRAGFQPHSIEPQPACQDAATCPRAAEQVLHQILRGIHAEQLDSWLALARSRGMSIPHAALVQLLDQGAQKPALRASITPLLGQRGRWLIAQHPAWSEKYGAADDAPETHWQHGNLDQRRAALIAMRRQSPATALAALESDWPQETVENRAALLPCLATGLSLQDEDFLNRVLDDKRKEVRTIAQQLLATLPGSQLSERCKARLNAIFTLERKTGLAARLGAMLGGGLPELQLELPSAIDAAMKRDGIGIETHRGLGEKAGWLLDLMRNVPPSHWSSEWQLTPRQVLDVLAKQEFHTALVSGVVQAAARALAVQPQAADKDWFIMLMTDGALNMHNILLPEMHRLPQEDQERIVKHWLEQGSNAYTLEWAEQRFNTSGVTLTPELSRLMLNALQRQLKAEPAASYQHRYVFTVLAKVLDTSVLAVAQTGWPASDWEPWPQWRQQVDDLIETLQFRTTMQASFLETHA